MALVALEAHAPRRAVDLADRRAERSVDASFVCAAYDAALPAMRGLAFDVHAREVAIHLAGARPRRTARSVHARARATHATHTAAPGVGPGIDTAFDAVDHAPQLVVRTRHADVERGGTSRDEPTPRAERRA